MDDLIRTIRYSAQREIHRRIGRRNDSLPMDVGGIKNKE